MGRLLGIAMHNFRGFRDLAVGRLQHDGEPLTALTALAGPDGWAPEAVSDALGFIKDCLEMSAGHACRARGGLETLLTDPRAGCFWLEVHARLAPEIQPVAWRLIVGAGEDGRPVVRHEWMFMHQPGVGWPRPLPLLSLVMGRGMAVRTDGNGRPGDAPPASVRLRDPRRPAAGSGTLCRAHPVLAALRRFVEGWSVDPGADSLLPLGLMAQLRPDGLARGLEELGRSAPDLADLAMGRAPDGRLTLLRGSPGDPGRSPEPVEGATARLVEVLIALECPDPPTLALLPMPEQGISAAAVETLRLRAQGQDAQVLMYGPSRRLPAALRPGEAPDVVGIPAGVPRMVPPSASFLAGAVSSTVAAGA